MLISATLSLYLDFLSTFSFVPSQPSLKQEYRRIPVESTVGVTSITPSSKSCPRADTKSDLYVNEQPASVHLYSV